TERVQHRLVARRWKAVYRIVGTEVIRDDVENFAVEAGDINGNLRLQQEMGKVGFDRRLGLFERQPRDGYAAVYPEADLSVLPDEMLSGNLLPPARSQRGHNTLVPRLP